MWVLAFLALGLARAWDDSSFMTWFTDELSEVTDVPLDFDGTVPQYIVGAHVQAGPGRFTMGSDRFTHLMDGFGKVNKVEFSHGSKPTFTAKFLRSNLMNESSKSGHICRSMFVGPIEPPKHWGPTVVMGPNDNNYIKIQQIGGKTVLLGDTALMNVLKDDMVNFDYDLRPDAMAMSTPGRSWKDQLDSQVGRTHICMLGTMAHAYTDPVTGVFTGIVGCQSIIPGPITTSYHIVFNIHPDAPDVRVILAKIPLLHGRRPSYMHTFGVTPNYVVLMAEPLFMDMMSIMEGKPLGRGGLVTDDSKTLFQVVNRTDGSVRTLEAPGFIYGHVLNTFEDATDIVVDLTWYPANNMTTVGWFNRFSLSYMADLNIRETWPKAEVRRYRLRADGQVEQSLLFKSEMGRNDFEVPKINELLMGRPYCMVYMMQFHSYEYHRGQEFMDPGPMGATGIAKRNLCTGERSGWYAPDEYPSEVQFIPNPNGKAEDDGVLIGMVFDGKANTSYYQILDAKTMTRVAKAPLPIRIPFLIHSSFFPEGNTASEIVV